MLYSNSMEDTYYENSVETQTPLNLVVKLYEGAIRFLYLAEKGYEVPEGQRLMDFTTINENLNKAQAIIIELRSSINHSGGEIATQLDSVYAYLYELLTKANYKKGLKKEESLNHLIEARSLLEELLESWYKIS